nr:MAG TPA: hypothetical protein [Caudoviricetes sp.]
MIRIRATPQLTLGVVLLHLQNLLHEVCITVTELLFCLLDSLPVDQHDLILAVFAAATTVVCIFCVTQCHNEIAISIGLEDLCHVIRNVQLGLRTVAILQFDAANRSIFTGQTLENSLRTGTAKCVICMIGARLQFHTKELKRLKLENTGADLCDLIRDILHGERTDLLIGQLDGLHVLQSQRNIGYCLHLKILLKLFE